MTLFVIVGNREESDEYNAKNKGKKGFYVIISPKALKDKIIGPKDKILFYGSAMKRRDIGRIMKEIDKCKKRFGNH